MFSVGVILSHCYLFGLLFFLLKEDAVKQLSVMTAIINTPLFWPFLQPPFSL